MTTPPTPRSDADEFGSASALRASVEPVACPNCPPGYDCRTGNYWTPVKVDNPTIGQALCLDAIHEADGSCCTEGNRQANPDEVI